MPRKLKTELDRKVAVSVKTRYVQYAQAQNKTIDELLDDLVGQTVTPS